MDTLKLGNTTRTISTDAEENNKIAAMYEDAKRRLNMLSDEAFDELAEEYEQWFDATLVMIGMNREEATAYILATDPVACEGGLFDFLDSQGLFK